MTDRQDTRIEYLQAATGENTKSKSLNLAVEFYIRMAGDTEALPSVSGFQRRTVSSAVAA